MIRGCQGPMAPVAFALENHLWKKYNILAETSQCGGLICGVLGAVTWGLGWPQRMGSCHVVAIIENSNLPHLLLATACNRLRISKNGGHPLNSPLNSTQDWHLGCIWFVEMKKTWSAWAWAMPMELQFFWQKSIRENPELLITFFDSVLWQAWNQLGCTCFFVVIPTVFLDFPVGVAFWQS